MKKIYIKILFITAFSFSPVIKADVVLQSFHTNSCADLVGKWSGTGKVTNWTIGQCFYRGNGNVTSIDAAGNFMFDLKINRESGSLICPKEIVSVMQGSCVHNIITLKTEYGSLKGNIAGNQGSASGKLTILKGIVADVAINLQRA